MNARRSAGFAILLALAATSARGQVSSERVFPSRVARSPLQRAPMRLIGPAPNQWGRSDLGIYESDNWLCRGWQRVHGGAGLVDGPQRELQGEP